MLTAEQIKWASQHDWFIRDNGNGSIDVLDRWSQLQPDKSITHHEETVHFTKGFRALRNWAGY